METTMSTLGVKVLRLADEHKEALVNFEIARTHFLNNGGRCVGHYRNTKLWRGIAHEAECTLGEAYAGLRQACREQAKAIVEASTRPPRAPKAAT
jgi:hypothetical protein